MKRIITTIFVFSLFIGNMYAQQFDPESTFAVSTTVDPTLPIPTNVSATAVSTNNIRVSWDEVSGARYYRLYRATNDSEMYSLVDTSTNTFHYSSSALDESTTYYYKVSAVTGNGKESEPSAHTSATTMSSLNIIRNSGDSNSNIGISYQGIPGVSDYGVTVKGSASPTSSMFIDFGVSFGFNDFSIVPYTNFCFSLPFDLSMIDGNWYAGIGIIGLFSIDDDKNLSKEVSFVAGNITTGFLLWEWLNISFTYHLGVNFNGEFLYNKFSYSTGYVYKFK